MRPAASLVVSSRRRALSSRTRSTESPGVIRNSRANSRCNGLAARFARFASTPMAIGWA